MITTFEKVTPELTEKELALVPIIIEGFKRYDKSNPIKEPEIVKRFNSKSYETKLTGARLRKIVNHIRVNGLLPLIATSKGYYVSYNKDEVLNQIKSLRERANSINSCADGLSAWL